MTRVYGLLLALAVYGVHVAIAPHLSIVGVRPNLLLLTVILVGVQWVHPGFFVLAALFGLSQDSFSHGWLGLYGVTFVFTGVLANLLGRLIYEHNLLFVMGIVFGLSLFHGAVALVLLSIVGSDSAWASWFFAWVLPQAVYHAVLTPLALLLLRRLARLVPPYATVSLP